MNNIDKSIFKYLASQRPTAYATIKGGNEAPEINGRVEFYQLGSGVIVVADIDGLPKTESNIFAFHIHEGESCDDDFSKTGGHFNPSGAPHPCHAGDMPPLFSNGGSAWQAFYTNRFKVSEIVGRVVIIHDGVDDFTSQPSGNSGNKIACGKIAQK